FATPDGLKAVPDDLCNTSFNDESSLSFFLPSYKDDGLIAYALLSYLFRKQNDMLEQCSKLLSIEKKEVVFPSDVTDAHLISYDLYHDLLPIIHANGQYSLEMGQGTKIEYDFEAMQRKLVSRFILPKSIVEMSTGLQIDLMVYKTELSSISVFSMIDETIPQQELDVSAKNQICSEFRTIQDVCSSIDHLDIMVNVLKTVGGKANENLDLFMREKLHMTKTFTSEKARSICNLEHVKSLWLLMSFRRNMLLVEHGRSVQDVFEHLPDKYRDEMPTVVEQSLQKNLKKVSIEKLLRLLEALHEFMTIILGHGDNNDNEEIDDTNI
ncbi:RN213-like protein, partial [Mya arenaria]